VTTPLVLSVFPGIDLLGRAFEQAGFCVVRGPDRLWGGEIQAFHPPAGIFDGLIGGPPCTGESTLAHLNGTPGYTLVDEFFRVVEEAQPAWWVMEAVKPHDRGYYFALSPRWLGEDQSRRRWFHSNLQLNAWIDVALFESTVFKHAVLAGHGGAQGKVTQRMAKYPFPEACRLQGLPPDFDLPGFTREAKYKAVGNGVPLSMGRAIARAVQRALAER
jgi:DNA (cytosine-5)-methyltransferase 1